MISQILNQIRYRFFEYTGKSQNDPLTTVEHIRLALQWFDSSLSSDGGVAAKYSMMTHQFAPSYPMATAMWVPVLSRIKQFYPEIYNEVLKDGDISRDLVKWLLRTQRRDGTFPGGYGDFMNQSPVVFNNGLIIHGLLDYYNAEGGNDLIDACRNSADWLLKVQSPDGSWRQYTFHQLSSNTLTASALIRLAGITGNNAYKEAGIKNINFALGLQTPEGYFKGNGFSSDPFAFNITIGYAIAGLLEAGILEGDNTWKDAALKAIIPIVNHVEQNGFLVGEFNEDFSSKASFACLPGSCLVAILAYKLSSITGITELKNKADLLVDYVKSRQLDSKFKFISGGISGSYPISGDYCSYEITSWGVRYFIEAVMIQDANQ